MKEKERKKQGWLQETRVEVVGKKPKEVRKEYLCEEQWHPVRRVTYRYSFPYSYAEEEKY